MHREPLAYFLTWTTYGTHLHYDERGSVDRNHNRYGSPRLQPDETYHFHAESSLKHPPVVLDDQHRTIVQAVIQEHSAIRKWMLRALNVRTNHVHVVVTAEGYTPEVVMDQFKSWGTRRLRAAGLIAAERPVWTSHGSTRYIWDSSGYAEAIDYVTNRQGPERWNRAAQAAGPGA